MSEPHDRWQFVGSIAVSYIAAVVAAAMFYVAVDFITNVGTDSPPLAPVAPTQTATPIAKIIGLYFGLVVAGILVGVFASYIGFFAFIPFVVALILLRCLRRSDIVSHLVAGLMVSGLSVFLVSSESVVTRMMIEEWTLVTAGGVAGVVYWWTFRRLSQSRPNAT